MWMECSHGVRFLISRLILTPLAAGVRVAVPTLWPCTFLISTVTGLAACARISRTTTRLAADKNSAAQTEALILFLLPADCNPGFGFSQKNAHVNLAQDRRERQNKPPQRSGAIRSPTQSPMLKKYGKFYARWTDAQGKLPVLSRNSKRAPKP